MTARIVRKPCIGRMRALALALGMAGAATAGPADKTIFAADAPAPPVIDGVLDDPCWRTAEVRDDFHVRTAVAGRASRLRLAYDAAALYIGLECEWDDAAALEAEGSASRERHGKPPAGITPAPDYGFEGPSLELFIDPGRTRENYDCVFVNAAGQWTGWFKYHVEQFDRFQLDKHVVTRSTVTGRCWTVEIAYPAAGIQAGDEWGFNAGRNDEGPSVAIWSATGVSWHDPGRFGSLKFGSVPAWWTSAWRRHAPERTDAAMQRLAERGLTRPWLTTLHGSLLEQAAALRALTRGAVPADRAEFDAVHPAFIAYRNTFDRLRAAQEAMLLVGQSETP